MPRRDGFPTNEEMLGQFNQNGRNIFVAALEHDFAHKIPDHMRGKQLAHLRLQINHIMPEPEEGITNAVTGEDLDMRIMDGWNVEFVRENHLRWKGTPIADRIDTEVTYFSDTVLDDTFVPATIGKWAVQTDYTAFMANTQRTRHVGTLKEKPTKMALVSGIALEEAAEAYVRSSDFEVPFRQRLGGVLLFGVGVDSFQPFDHKWFMPFQAGMTFNGFESRYYLEGCLERAQQSLQTTTDRLARLKDLGAPERILESDTNRLAELRTSIASAKTALEKKRGRQ